MRSNLLTKEGLFFIKLSLCKYRNSSQIVAKLSHTSPCWFKCPPLLSPSSSVPPPPPNIFQVLFHADENRSHAGARAERRVRRAVSTTVGHGQTVSERASSARADVWRNGNNTVRALRPLGTPGENRVGEWKLEEFMVRLTGHAFGNSVESGDHVRIGRNP